MTTMLYNLQKEDAVILKDFVLVVTVNFVHVSCAALHENSQLRMAVTAVTVETDIQWSMHMMMMGTL